MTLKWNFQRGGGGFSVKNLPWEGYGYFLEQHIGGEVASWLVPSTPERAVRVRALAGDIVLCSWARHLTLTVPLSTQVNKLNAGG